MCFVSNSKFARDEPQTDSQVTKSRKVNTTTFLGQRPPRSGFDTFAQRPRVEWLRDHIRDAKRVEIRKFILVRPGRQKNHWDRRKPVDGSQSHEQIRSGHTRHHHIQKENIRCKTR